jgi:hypothetical protein
VGRATHEVSPAMFAFTPPAPADFMPRARFFNEAFPCAESPHTHVNYGLGGRHIPCSNPLPNHDCCCDNASGYFNQPCHHFTALITHTRPAELLLQPWRFTC